MLIRVILSVTGSKQEGEQSCATVFFIEIFLKIFFWVADFFLNRFPLFILILYVLLSYCCRNGLIQTLDREIFYFLGLLVEAQPDMYASCARRHRKL